MREYGFWTDGQPVRPSGVEWMERSSPASGELVARFALASESDLDCAARLARQKFHEGVWSVRSGSERSRTLQSWGDLILADLDRLAQIEAEEAGKTISAARAEITWSVDLLRFAASLAWSIPGRVVSHEGLDRMGLVTFEAIPVVGMILPWNFPTVTLFQKLPFALAAGCSVVVKPSEYTAGTAYEYAALAAKAGIPDGVIAVLAGSGVLGEAMCRHPDIDMVSFTGSTAVGRKVASIAGQNLKKVALELGGKGANIVFADADLDAAMAGALAGFTINQGEECCAGSRLLIDAAIADDFVKRLALRAERMILGGADRADAELGPLIHEHHLSRVLAYVDGAVREGAQLLTGGKRVGDEPLAKGHFVAPTILDGVAPDMTIFREEVFGPVLAVTRFSSEEEAVRLANSTRYGLANGVWTSDLSRGHRVARALRSGFVYVNTYLEALPQMPFGGIGESGIGRENGIEGLLEFMRSKSTFIRLAAAT